MGPNAPIKYFSVVALLAALAGCATPPMHSERVTVLRQSGAYSGQCRMLGTVSSSVNPWKFASGEEAMQQALWNMQAEAYEKFQADTLALQQLAFSLTEAGGYGVALKCYGVQDDDSAPSSALPPKAKDS